MTHVANIDARGQRRRLIGGVVWLAVATAAGGSIKSIKTTPLMTIEEGIAAMKKAGQLAYVPPGASAAGV